MSRSINDWVNVTRYWSLPIVIMPVIITFSYLWSVEMFKIDGVQLLNLLLVLLCVSFIHIACNITVDLFDFRTGVDTPHSYTTPYLVLRKFYPEEYRDFAILLFFLGVATGAVLTFRTGPTLLLLGSIGLILSAAYPFFKYHALGNLCILIIISTLSVLGTSYVCVGRVIYNSLLVALPVEMIIFAMMHANNILNLENNRKAKIKTSAMLMSGTLSAIVYIAALILPFVIIALFVLTGILHWWAFLCYIALFQTVKNLKQAFTYKKNGVTNAMQGLDSSSVSILMVFSISLSLALFAVGLFN